MKIIVFPDCHGRPYSKVLENIFPAFNGIIVFLGDYFDSFDYSVDEQIKEFERLLDFKRAFPRHIHFLLGNHDIQYLYPENTGIRCTGYQPNVQITSLLQDHPEFFNYAFHMEHYLFTHAGVSSRWLDIVKEKYKINSLTTAEEISAVVNYEFKELFWIGRTNGGIDQLDGPLWIRPDNLKNYLPEGITQVVGHTYDSVVRIYPKLHVIDTGKPVVYLI